MAVIAFRADSADGSRIDVEVDESPEQWPIWIGVSKYDTKPDESVSPRELGLTMDEARQVIAGLAAVIR